MIHRLPTVRSDCGGFEHLGHLAAATSDLFAEKLTLDMSRVRFFDANMAAPLGAILSRVADNFNHVEVVALRDDVGRILRKNGFLTHYWCESLEDSFCTTMPFRRFRLLDEGAFEDYVHRQLRDKGMPVMTVAASRAFRRKVFEVYQNAVIHSESDIGVFACGQFFPNRNRLDFTVADGGMGIRDSVRRYFGQPRIDSIPALEWALKPNHTTKRGPQPGGLGLGFLQEFSRLNRGKIQIVSRFAFYEFTGGQEHFRKMSADFPGTAVTIEVNTADETTYSLTSETASEDIF